MSHLEHSRPWSRAVAVVATVVSVTGLALVGVTPASIEPAAAAHRPGRVVGCGGEHWTSPAGGLYTCTFEDDFNGTALDPTKWRAQETAATGIRTNTGGCYVDDPANLWVSGGQVHLTARHEARAFLCHTPRWAFRTTTSIATIASIDRFSQTYGRFEFRARFPAPTAQGLQSALWLYPQKQLYGAWPRSGEIDVAEYFSVLPDNVYPSVHYGGENTRLSSGRDCLVPAAGSAFHRYAVEWTPTVMTFFYDGVPCFSHQWTPRSLARPKPFDQPFYLVLSQIFGSGANRVTAATSAVATMDVDWVRAWR